MKPHRLTDRSDGIPYNELKTTKLLGVGDWESRTVLEAKLRTGDIFIVRNSDESCMFH